jgi:hypothetical protein
MPTLPTLGSKPTPTPAAPSKTMVLPPRPEGPPVDPLAQAERLDRLKREQRFGGAVLAGSVAALLGAIVWAAITVATKYQIGWMAVGIGALVGITMRKVGRGVEARFGVVAAALALLGCLLGNLFAAVGMVASTGEESFFSLLARVDFDVAKEILAATFSPMDLLFYGIAVMEAFKFAFDRVDSPPRPSVAS